MKRFLYAITLALACIPATKMSASDLDSARTERARMWNDTRRAGWTNPALYGTAFRKTHSALFFQSDWGHEKIPVVMEKGSGQLSGALKAVSYIRLSDRTTVWGAASYTTGETRNITWNSTTDYHLLAPYVLADTVGGNTRSERYCFSGGYSARMGQWTAAGELLFRAEQEYRKRDPRMRGIVSDLTLRVGAARDWGLERWALAAEANIYKQNNDVVFHQEAGGVIEYQMTGLGTYNARFTASATSMYYKGGGIGLQIDAHPISAAGWFGTVALSAHHYERISNEYNSLPLTTLYVARVGLTAGWKREGARCLAVFGHFNHTRKSGDEHVAGNAVGGEYPVLADLTIYKHRLTDASLHAVYGEQNCICWYVRVAVGYRNSRERYAYPLRQMDDRRLYGRLDTQWLIPVTRRFTFECVLGGSYSANIDKAITMPYANMEASFIRKVNATYRQLTANCTAINGKLRGDYTLAARRLTVYCELVGSQWFSNVQNNGQQVGLTLGITY